MPHRSLPEWLRWQESLHPRSIDLRLERVREVARRLGCDQAGAPVFTVAGTNGKGSTVALLEGLLRQAGRVPGVYTSPHLIDYHERIRVDSRPATELELVEAFERIDAARAGISLTFFEFGTLAAFLILRERGADVWVLEVGMGGRLDAVNIVDPDFALITTVGLDHQAFLGDTVEQIAAEKAGIMRPGRPAFFGDWPVPQAVRHAARATGAHLHCLGEQFDFTPSLPLWSWRGAGMQLDGLAYPPAATAAQLRNISGVLAAIEQFDPALLGALPLLNEAIVHCRPPGRFQIVRRDHEWVLDVAHNPQAAAVLYQQLGTLPPAADTTVVIGMLDDKNLAGFVGELAALPARWIACAGDDPRARSAEGIAKALRAAGIDAVRTAATVEDALALARDLTQLGGRIVVCGSFRVVGPALRWLGIY